jgi:hypothetical protein
MLLTGFKGCRAMRTARGHQPADFANLQLANAMMNYPWFTSDLSTPLPLTPQGVQTTHPLSHSPTSLA